MQSLPINPVDLATSILSEIESYVASRQDLLRRGEFTRWTSDIKAWLNCKGESLDYYSIYTDGLDTSEFMLDFVWWKKGIGGCAVLACEIEWGNTRDHKRNAGRVAEDFDKLLSFKAPLKLMIFSSDNRAMQKETTKELNRYLREYGDHRKGEQYLVLDVKMERKTAWLCEVVKDGFDGSLLLNQLA